MSGFRNYSFFHRLSFRFPSFVHILFGLIIVSMHYLFLTSLLAALNLSPSVIATGSKPPPVIKSAWREYWKAEFPIANISWDKYNSISWAFVGLSSNCKITVDLSSSSDLATFVEEAHKNVRIFEFSHEINSHLTMIAECQGIGFNWRR